MANNDLIDSAEAAELLGGVHLSTLTRWEQVGRLKVARRLGAGRHGVRLFRRSDVLKLKADLDAKAAAKTAVA